jgi:signal transduction histidine kinase
MTSSDASQVIDSCLAIFSHEVRSPLSTILGWAQIIATKDLTADRLQLACRAIQRSAHEITALVCEVGYLRSFVQSNRDHKASYPTTTTVLHLAIEEVRDFAEERRISISLVDTTEQSHVGISDKHVAVQIIASLIAHAIRVTQPGGEVAVEAGLHNDSLEVSVKAVGCEEDLHLAIARYLAELCGGTLSLPERGYGEPALMVATIPVSGALNTDALEAAQG